MQNMRFVWYLILNVSYKFQFGAITYVVIYKH